MRTPKQLLNITGGKTMLRDTVERLGPLFSRHNLWAVTNVEQAAAVHREMTGVAPSQILAEPAGRNTAAAIGLAAIHIAHVHGDALMTVLPSDSYIADAVRYRRLVRAALELARTPGNLVVLGIPPTRPETGYGYIERSTNVTSRPLGIAACAVRRFTEKPALPLAKRYVASGKFLWNAGMFFWRASTFLDNLRQFLPETHEALLELSRTIGTSRYSATLQRIYSKLKNISVDYAVMEPASRLPGAKRVFVIPAKVGWSDIGSWAAVYELLAATTGANVSAGPSFALDASGNYFWSPKKLVAAVGIHDLIVVETDDALLICDGNRAQDVGQIVKWLEAQTQKALL